jgi:hypothetical protein
VLADSNAALSGPITEGERAAWLDMLALVEDLLALRRQLGRAEAALLGLIPPQ